MCFLWSYALLAVCAMKSVLVSSVVLDSIISCDPWPEKGGNDRGPAGIIKFRHYDCQSLAPIHCINGTECNVYCEEDIANRRRRRQLLQNVNNSSGCAGIDIYCPSSAVCNIFCTYSCSGMIVHAETSTLLSIKQCGTNQMTDTGCDDLTIYCPLSAHSAPGRSCIIGDRSDKSITGLQIYAAKSFNDINISTINLLGTNIMHCGSTTKQNCVIDTTTKSQCISSQACDVTNTESPTSNPVTNIPSAAPTKAPNAVSLMPSQDPISSIAPTKAHSASRMPSQDPISAPTDASLMPSISHVATISPTQPPSDTLHASSVSPTDDPISHMPSSAPIAGIVTILPTNDRVAFMSSISSTYFSEDEGYTSSSYNADDFGIENKKTNTVPVLYIVGGAIAFLAVVGLFLVLLLCKRKRKADERKLEKRRSSRILMHTIPGLHMTPDKKVVDKSVHKETMDSLNLSVTERETHKVLAMHEEEEEEDSYSFQGAAMTQNVSYAFRRSALNVESDSNLFR